MKNNVCSSGKNLTFRYKFRFSTGNETCITVSLDSTTLNLIRTAKATSPSWTELSFFKCPHCPLDMSEHSYCPVATGLTDLIDAFKNAVSYEEVDVSIEADERTYLKHTSLQKGLSPLVGIYMASSGCPVMERLKPMVRYHLPFATEEETKYRVLSMYLLAQYFLFRQGRTPDWEMKDLITIYEDVRTVNRYIAKRLSEIKIEDANINALFILDCFADSVKFSLNRDMLHEIETLFQGYLKQQE